MKKFLKKMGKLIVILLLTIAVLLSLSMRWLLATWKSISINEVIFHLKAPLEGTSDEFIIEYLLQCLLPTIIIIGLVLVGMHLLKKISGLLLTVVFVLSCAGLVYMTCRVWVELDVETYINGQMEESKFIETYYVDPGEVMLSFPDKKKNLIYIFTEFMECTYADKANGGAFEKNVIKELTSLAQENEDFSGNGSEINGGYVMPGATWTMGALFAHTAGLPLNISIGGNDMDTQESFFSGVTALGDILQQAGYSQSFILGSAAEFGGREMYFAEHGNYNILDYDYMIENGILPKDYQVWWGYEDEKLFEYAKEELLNLSQKDAPFNVTLLTADTHFEDGYICEACGNEYDDQYANVMACSSKKMKEFVQWIQNQEFYEDTVIVISGDHLTMDSNFCENVSTDYDRKVYTVYINSEVKSNDIRREYTTFDNFPTTLAALGVEIPGNRLGLGTNLFSQEKTLTELVGVKMEERELKCKSLFLEELAEIDEESESLKKRRNEIYTADIEVEPKVGENNQLSVHVKNINVGLNEIKNIKLAIWGQSDQSDLQWIYLSEDSSETYSVNIDTNSLVLADAEYEIHVYVEMPDKEDEFLCSSKININE